MTLPFIIAIDGPNASGKGTLARRLGKELGFPVLDTGLLYRAVAWMVLEKGHSLNDENAALHCADELHTVVNDNYLDNPGLRGIDIGNAASIVSSYPSVRQSLFDLQRNFALKPIDNANGSILDGRDIGTVICPDAAIKFFVTASPEIRAERRAREQYGEAWESYFKEVLEKTRERDRRDSERAVAPLKPAVDSIILDTSRVSPDEVFRQAYGLIRSRLDEHSEKK